MSARPSRLAPEVQHTNKCEKPACRVDINNRFPLKPLLKYARAFHVDTATRHIDCFDLARGKRFDRIKVARANLEVVLNDLTKRPQR